MACYFSSNRPIGCVRNAATDLTSISCDAESIKPVSEFLTNLSPSINLYGCTAIEILFLRSNGEQIDDVENPTETLICKAHFDFLLLKWPNKSQYQKSMQKGKSIVKCSLFHESARADEVTDWLKLTGELVHVGSPICTTHRSRIQQGEMETTVLSRRNNPPKRTKSGIENDEDFNFDSIDLGSNDEMDFDSCSDNDDRMVPSTDPSLEIRDQISSHFSAIAKLLGSNRYTTQHGWKELSEVVKRKKISLVLTMVQMLCSFVAPGYGDELADSISGKLSSQKNINSESCSQQVLSAIGDRILEAPNRRTRIETLALIVNLPFFSSTKILTTIPTVTKYLIHKARLFNCGGIDFDQKYTKVRFNQEAIDFFVSFVVRSNIVMSLAWINNYATKSDGSKVEMGASVRLHSYISIDRRYREELRKYNKAKSFHLSYGTIYKMLQSIFPRKNKRMVCVDEYLVDAGEGWDRLKSYINALGRMGYLLSTEETDLERRVKLSRSFLEGSFRSHIESTSNVLDHCARFALSDMEKPAYRMICDHEHDSRCEECMEIDRVLSLLTDKLSSAKDKSKKGNSAEKFELERMIGMAQKCVKYIKAYQKHIIRAVISDTEKSAIQAALNDNEALITSDWAQKVLPQSAIEPQSGYYGKGGISIHITHIYAKLNGLNYHHAIQHVFESSKQQSCDVSSILRHALRVLEKRGIVKVTLRSDNAGCYKSSDLVGDLFHVANATPRIDRYVYSESQAGKGPCDRNASHMKRRITECTESRKNVRDAKEVFDALTKKDVVKGTSTYLCVGGSAEKEKGVKSGIKDISLLYDIIFEEDGILSRKHSGIGKGQTTAQSKLGGCIDDSNFWVCLNGDETEKEDEPDGNIDEPLSLRKDYVCSTPGCTANFLRLSNLEKHEIIGNHKFKSTKQSLLDYAIDAFNEKIETVQVAQEGRAIDSFSNAVGTDSPLEMGWALKKTENDGISDLAYKEAADYFMAQRTLVPPRRAEPRGFSLMMESMRNPDGNYKFKAQELLSEKQLTGLFSRFETKRVSGVTIARKPRGRQQSKGSRKRPRPASPEEVIVANLEENEDDLEGDEYEPEMDEEDFVRDCIQRSHNDIFL